MILDGMHPDINKEIEQLSSTSDCSRAIRLNQSCQSTNTRDTAAEFTR